MALTANELINDALAEAYPYSFEDRHSPAALLRQLSALEEEVIGWYALTRPERLSVAGSELLVVVATNLTGYPLTNALFYTDFKWEDKDGNLLPITIVPEAHYDSPVVHPSAVIRGSTLFPCDPWGTRWDTSSIGVRPFFVGDGDKIQYRYVTRPVRLGSLTNVLISPDEARQYLIASLKFSILLGVPGVPQEVLQVAADTLRERRSFLIFQINKREPVTSGNVSRGED